MENFPSNSHESKALPPKESQEKEPQEKKKRVLKVVDGEVVRRKKSLSSRFFETFFGEDGKSVGVYVVQDVLLPALKDMIADALSQGVERALFGETRSASRRTGYRSGGSSVPVNYSRYSSSIGSRREEPRSISRRSRATHNFDDIIIATRAEADEVVEQMFELLERYRVVSVSDLYELVGVDGSFTDEKWGWTNLRGIGVSRIREGYVLNLPRTEPLD